MGTKDSSSRSPHQSVPVWDTVKSLGFPWAKRVPHKESKQYDFVNYRLTPNIDNAFQALSLDERRWHFPPVVWSKSHSEQALKQCWFLGSHSDIGGGYRHAGFANISLCWMISQLRHLVLFNEKAIWHSTEGGRILGVDVAKENRELSAPSRGRIMGMANRISPFPRAKSVPPNEKISSDSRESFLPFSRYPRWSRSARSQGSAKGSSTNDPGVPSITVSEAEAEPDSNTQEREAEDMYEPSLPVPPDSNVVTFYEASLNLEAEAEAANVGEDSDGSSSTTSDADESGRPLLEITNMRRYTWPGVWIFGGSKTRKVGIHRKAGDDFKV